MPDASTSLGTWSEDIDEKVTDTVDDLNGKASDITDKIKGIASEINDNFKEKTTKMVSTRKEDRPSKIAVEPGKMETNAKDKESSTKSK